jgi:hypothetical protein
MSATHEWDHWAESWREARTTPAEIEQMIERTRRARRGILLVRILSIALAVTALLVVAAALRHAGNRAEAALGLVVGFGIATVWLVDAVNQRRATDKVEALPDEYLAARRALCTRQLRFVRLGWIVVALDLMFLFPWWIGGIRVHGSGFHLSQVLSVWAPLAAMIGFTAWTIVVRKRVLGELRQLARTTNTTTHG